MSTTVAMKRNEMKTKKMSLKSRIWNYLLENVDIIAPGIQTMDGEYYPGNYRRQ